MKIENFGNYKAKFILKHKKKKLYNCKFIVSDPDKNLKVMDQNFPFGGRIGYGNSCIGFFTNSKNFRLHATLHESSGSVKQLLKKKKLDFFMLHLVSPVHAFLVT